MNLTENDVARFWSKVDRRGENECWNWKASKRKNGYGQFGIRGKVPSAHVIAWQIAHGREPREGYDICHAPVICHNRACCNPAHLDEKTRQENLADMDADGTRAFGEHLTHNRQAPRGDDHYARKHPELIRRGAQVATSKLTQDDVNQIRALRRQGVIGRIIGKMFGVSESHVSRIEHHKEWRSD